jgi:cellulose biosynthesis protein BcsQ
MQLAFWSNFHGQTATTTSMAVLASTIALKYPLKILIAQVHSANSTLEKCFIKDFDSKGHKSMVENNGIDALIRMMKNGKLTPDQIVNYTLPILKESRLDLLIGTNNPDEGLFYENAAEITRIFKLASKTYDLVMIDTPSGLSNPISQDILNHATGVVVCLNQNKNVFEQYAGSNGMDAIRGLKPVVCLGRYDPLLSLTAKNIHRQFKMDKVIAVPQASEIQEAINHHELLYYLVRQVEGRSKTGHPQVMKTLIESSSNLLKYYGLYK